MIHANEEHSRLKVLPVPVGDSRTAFVPFSRHSMTLVIYAVCKSYGSNGNITGIPDIVYSGIVMIEMCTLCGLVR